ncbi:MAG TPA: Gfo/Idh/MocA family oxidoreductase [Acidimicrobiales bacterium]|nr:Gfo/Idh/MocA family oxidoreductase [Acidimicrobiales bacterium]
MTVRVAVVGCGSIARRAHLPGLRQAGADVVAFASRSRASAMAAAAEWGSGEVVDEWQDAVTRSDVDAVAVCTPNRLHAEIAVAAARAGKHVLVEKPMGCTVEECDRMMAAASATGVVLVPAQNMRFVPPFVAVRDAVAAGRIGTATGFRAALGHGGPESWGPASSWFRDAESAGGGALLDLGVHVVDVVRSVLADDVVEVTAFLQPLRGTPGPGVEDEGMALLRLRGGAVGSVHASWAIRSGRDYLLSVFGTEAALHLDTRTPPTLFTAAGEAEPLPVPDDAGDPYRAFVQAVTTGTPPPVTAADGRAAVAAVCAAYQSAATGKAIALP